MKTEATSGIGFGGILFIVFLVLKLTNVIDWSWWWITSPIWIPLAIGVIVMIGAVLFQYIKYKRNEKVTK